MIPIVKRFRYLLESYGDARERFISQGFSPDEVDAVIDKFRSLKTLKKIRGEEGDIDRYKTFEDLKTRVYQGGGGVPSKDEPGTRFVFENEDWLVLEILTKEASIKLGQETGPPRWCISRDDDENKWEEYKKDWSHIFFVFNKRLPKTDPKWKMVVLVGDLQKDVWNAKNENVTKKYSENVEGLPIKIFGLDLSDPKAFLNWLRKKCGIYIREDGTVDVEGTVYISGLALTKIPVKFGNVTGDFSCSYNRLTSLQGAPEKVRGNFSCYYNRLTSLKGAPERVGGSFYCYNNRLTSLKGAPRRVGRSFYCSHNRLTSLEGSPEFVAGEFDCSHNRLASLKGIPKKIGGKIFLQGNPVNFTEEDIRKAQEES